MGGNTEVNTSGPSGTSLSLTGECVGFNYTTSIWIGLLTHEVACLTLLLCAEQSKPASWVRCVRLFFEPMTLCLSGLMAPSLRCVQRGRSARHV
jgi:hypothetical protein